LNATDIGPPLTRDLCNCFYDYQDQLVYIVTFCVSGFERVYTFFVRLQRVGENCLALISHHSASVCFF